MSTPPSSPTVMTFFSSAVPPPVQALGDYASSSDSSSSEVQTGSSACTEMTGHQVSTYVRIDSFILCTCVLYGMVHSSVKNCIRIYPLIHARIFYS